MGYWDAEKRDPGQLFDLQGSPSPRSRMVHPDGQENLAKTVGPERLWSLCPCVVFSKPKWIQSWETVVTDPVLSRGLN